MDNSKPKAFIFMKVGPHGGETLDEILDRKNRELKKAGMIFWSYGEKGPLHPTEQVQPFVERWVEKLDYIEVLMEPTKARSQYGPAAGTANSYSARNNKEGRESIPKGILTAPPHALMLGEIRRCDLKLDLRDCELGIGDNERTNAAQYLAFRGMKEQTGRGRGADKGCLVERGQRKMAPLRIKR